MKAESLDLTAGLAPLRLQFANPVTNITPARLGQQLAAFRRGDLRDFALTMEQIEERDDVLANVIPKAKAAVARHGFEIGMIENLPEGSAELAQRQKTALEYFYNNVRVSSALEPEELGEFGLLVRQMMAAKGQRYAVHHLIWQPGESGNYTAKFIYVPLWFFENRTGPLRFIDSPFGYDGKPMEPGAWLVTVGAGTMRACSVAWMFKRMPLHSWISYCEKHGFPGVHGKIDVAKESPEFKEFEEAVAKFSQDWSVVTNREAEIALIEAKNSGSLPYPPLVERMDRALAAMWRGADLSTISAGSGTGQGASLQSEEAEIIETDDANWISETLRLKIDRLVLDYTFGEGTPALAYVKVRTAAKKNTELDLKVDEMALKVGHPISQAQFAERYDRPLPKTGTPAEQLLHPPVGGSVSFSPGENPNDAPRVAGEQIPAANEAGAQGRQALFDAHALDQLSAAQAAALKPLTDRLAEIADIEDEAAQEAALTKLRAEMPRLYRRVLNDPAVADCFEKIIGSALVSGAAEGAAGRQPAVASKP